MSFKNKLALVSDRILDGLGGAESVLFAAHDLYPDASAYITVYDRNILPQEYKDIAFKATLIQSLPLSINLKAYKAYFPLLPIAIEALNMQEYDVIFSIHHCVAKGIIPRPDAIHICYCFSPARYIWDLLWTYSNLNRFGYMKQLLTVVLTHYMRLWDVSCSNRISHYFTCSKYVAQRIKMYYNREAEILYPPVDTNKFNYEESGDYYLMVGRLCAYKGFELAIDAFNESGKKLIIIGNGPEFNKLKSKINSNIDMLGRVPDDVLIKYMNNCKAFIYSGKEDFGIVMAEAQSAGKPVIALGAGGAIDIVMDNETGLLFDKPKVESLNNAVKQSELVDWDYKYIADYSKKFDKQLFMTKLKDILENADVTYTKKTKSYF